MLFNSIQLYLKIKLAYRTHYGKNNKQTQTNNPSLQENRQLADSKKSRVVLVYMRLGKLAFDPIQVFLGK